MDDSTLIDISFGTRYAPISMSWADITKWYLPHMSVAAVEVEQVLTEIGEWKHDGITFKVRKI